MLDYRILARRSARSENMGLGERFSLMSKPLLLLMCGILIFSLAMLYSAGGGHWNPYALPQLLKIVLGFGIFFLAALSNIKTWLRFSYLFYAVALFLVLLVLLTGHTGMGAQRWLNLGFFTIQPSEFIKIALVMVLARYFAWHNSAQVVQIKNYIIPVILFLVPFALIVAQPDLGTGMSLALTVIGMFFIVGANKNWFLLGIIMTILAAPVLWHTMLRDYQKDRIITFMNSDHDLKGSGYQIAQAKIAFGSGGLTGNGYMQGTQNQNQFLPEKQTDFIWTMVGEELGFFGALLLLGFFYSIAVILYRMSKLCRSRYAQLMIFGFGINWFAYYFINIGMNMGLLPTVGVPLPLFSFGGSALLSLLFGFGLVQNCWVHRDLQLSAKGG
ncbi:MAG: rod shape-determining protein RodA [Rickettsiales bacterium]|jgi:rod shape determining protein RodA|nr:rod shape-determining protein RodA [Rickettsiales bacterium]